MNRRYDMRRSDNSPVSGNFAMLCPDTHGEVLVPVGFPVTSAIVIPDRDMPLECDLRVDMSREQEDGFYVVYEGLDEDNPIVSFQFTVQ